MIIENTEVVLKADSKTIVLKLKDGTNYAIPTTDAKYGTALDLYRLIRNAYESDRPKYTTDLITLVTSKPTEEGQKIAVEYTEEDLNYQLDSMLNFFKEFEFTPSFRFINTLAQLIQKSNKEAINYIRHYFALIDSPYATTIESKCKCAEFSKMLEVMKAFPPKQEINTRLAIYYGAQGTGKTTIAQEQCEGRCVICNNSMIPSDLMEDFIFIDGKPSFKPSALWECITQGKPIVLDEMNLLPFESLRFLQGLLDGKETFLYKGNEIKVAQGFKVIGTMNLVVDGAVFSLPTPLVDRCNDIEEFELSAKQLMGAIL